MDQSPFESNMLHNRNRGVECLFSGDEFCWVSEVENPTTSPLLVSDLCRWCNLPHPSVVWKIELWPCGHEVPSGKRLHNYGK